MFQGTSAWFSSSVDSTFIELWTKQGGKVEDTYRAEKLPEYLFSCDLEEHDTQRIIKYISDFVIHPDWIFDTIINKRLKPIKEYILSDYSSQNTITIRKSSNKVNSNGPDILADLANHNHDDYIIAHSPIIPSKKYYLPRSRARKVSKGKNPDQDNIDQDNIDQDNINIDQDNIPIMTDTMSFHSDNTSQDLQFDDLQSDAQGEGNSGSVMSSPNENLSSTPKKSRPRTLPDFMSRKRPRVVPTNTSEDDSFFSEDEDLSKKRKKTNCTQDSVRTSSTGKTAPSIRCECGRSIQSTMSSKQLLESSLKDSPQNTNKETRSITSIRLQHIPVPTLFGKVFKYLQVVKGANSSLMDDVCEFTPGQNGFSARVKSTTNSRASSVNSHVQTRGKSSPRKT